MEQSEIFELIVKADEKLKYATDTTADKRAEQARALLDQAKSEAEAIGNEQLIEQAQRRLDELDA